MPTRAILRPPRVGPSMGRLSEEGADQRHFAVGWPFGNHLRPRETEFVGPACGARVVYRSRALTGSFYCSSGASRGVTWAS